LTGSLPRSLRWIDAVELIGKLGTIELHVNAEVAFVVGSERAFFKRPSTHIFEVSEVSRLRRLLSEAGLSAALTEPVEPVRVVVVIDHHLARVYGGLDGSRPQRQDAVRPYDPHGFHHHLIHRKEAHYQGERVPEEPSFYETVAKDLVLAREIVLVGHGTGKSSALEVLVEYLKKHHPAIYQRVIRTEITDLSALTEPETKR